MDNFTTSSSFIKLARLLLLAGDINANPGPTAPLLKIACANVRSLPKNAPTVTLFVGEARPHCLLLKKTWLQQTTTEAHLKGLTPSGFSLLHRPCNQ